VCLNEGCIPSKAFLHSAKLYEAALHGANYGVTITGASLDHAAVVARKNKVVRTLVAGVKAKMKHAGVAVVEGEARLTGRTVEGFAAECGGEAYEARRLLIAVGSEPIVPPIPGLREGLNAGFALTNREALDLPAPPEHLVIIGGGVIGLEMASYYRSAGSQVTVVEMLDHVAGLTDEEIGRRLQKQLEKDGVAFHLSARVTAVEKDAVVFERDGRSERIACDKALLSIGRRAVTSGYGR
jgi:dihydrolipoamide dehydrogenase